MTRIIVFILACFFIVPSFAQKPLKQQFLEEHRWQRFQELRNDGLAQDEVLFLDSVLNASIKNKQTEEFFLALNEYSTSISNSLLEKNQKHEILEKFEVKALEIPAPFSNMMHAFLAQQYQSYGYAWNLVDWQGDFAVKCILKGKEVLYTNTDYELQNEIILNHYQLSIVPNSEFLKLDLRDFIQNQSELYYAEYPSLADYYASFYVSHLKATNSIQFEINDVNQALTLFGPTDSFNKSFSTEVLKAYSDMEFLNFNKKEVYAFVNWRLMRMEYVNSLLHEITDSTRIDSYLKAVADFKIQLNNLFEEHPARLAVILREAEIKASDVRNQYNWKSNPAAKEKLKEEYELIAKGLTDFPKSLYADLANSRLKDIESKKVSVNFQKQNLSSKVNLLSISYQNIPQAHLAIYYVDGIKKEKFTYNPLKNFQLSAVYQQDLKLDVNGKYNLHSKDFIIPALKREGKYLILIAENKESLIALFETDSLTLNNSSFAYAEFYQSNLVVSNKNEGNEMIWLIQENKKGSPIAGASIYLKDDQGYSMPSTSKLLGKTDQNGFFKSTTALRGMNWVVVYKNDSVSGYSNNYQNRFEPKKGVKTKIITDRGIYRPGQKVYFKLYAFEGESPHFKAVSNYETELYLEDDNGTEFGELKLKTNEFGTVSGSFDLPTKGFLPGQFIISDFNSVSDYESNTSFLVEEYKRPSFEVKADFEKKTYQIDDEVNVIGSVTAYAGFGMKDTKIHVVVESNPSYWRTYNSNPTKILDTTISSNSQGAFSFSFVAKKSESRYGSNFSYSVSATSSAGETQQISNSIFIGKTKAEWILDFPREVLSSSKAFGIVTMMNADSVDQAKTINLEIWKSNSKSKPVFHFFEPKEFHEFTAESFNKQFLYSFYGSEKDYLNYEKMKTISIRAGDSVDIHQLINQQPGSYQVRLINTEDEFNKDENNSYVANFNYIAAKTKKNQHNEKLWIHPNFESAKVGNEVSFLIGSSFKKLNAKIEVYRGKDLVNSTTKKIKGRTWITYTIRKEDLGGITMYVRAISNGEVLTAQSDVAVPFDELKGLDIQLQTERTILRPGQSEIWKLKVSSKDSSPLSAEGVATLTDASLKAFRKNSWYFDIYRDNYFQNSWQESGRNLIVFFRVGQNWNGSKEYRVTRNENSRPSPSIQYKSTESASDLDEVNVVVYKLPLIALDGGASEGEVAENEQFPAKEKDKVRSNMNETAFFYPTLYSSADNEYKIEFTLPDALTSWDFQAMFHDKAMRIGKFSQNFVAQKELMIQPNAPRFFRAGDEVEFAANAINLMDNPQDITVSLEWFDPFTNEVLPNVFGILESKTLKLDSKENQTVFWKLNIPKSGVELIAYRIRVASAEFSDAEEKAIPVLSNRTQVIESVPVTIESAGNYTYDLTKLTKSTSNTQINQSLVLEYNSNPIWSVVMAVPYVMDQTTESADQIFNTYFINQLSQQIIEKNPAIETVLSMAGNTNPDLFLSTLDKNPELKDIILAETPWLLDSKSESMQRKRISSLFNSNNLDVQEQQLLDRLNLLKNSDGGWSWFGNGTSNVYITQYILAGFGHLKSLDVENKVDNSLNFLEQQYATQFAKLTKEQRTQFNSISSMEIQWLYIRSMFDMKSTDVSDYYTACLKKQWTKQSLQIQAMAGIYFANVGEDALADKILKSILNRKTTKKNLGTFWNENSNGYSWERNTIETQATLINFFNRMEVDKKIVNSMKMWLLNQKRGQAWESSKATSLACHAMLVGASPVSATSIVPTIQLGNEKIDASAAAKNLGYLKQTWTGKEIEPSMGKMSVTQTVDEPAFGSLSLVYTEEIDKIEKNNTGIGIDKKMYLIQDGKEVLITPTTVLQLGDLVRVRLQVETDQALEFVHIKDTKASGTENVQALSGHQSEGNLYYYQVMHDASTDFFIDYLARGKHHLTYDLRVSGKGVQSTGYALVECMYSPEFRANTKSNVILVK